MAPVHHPVVFGQYDTAVGNHQEEDPDDLDQDGDGDVSEGCDIFLLKFGLTLTSHNSGLKNDSIKNHDIFRIGRTSAFKWYTRIPPRLRLHSFGPLWTISTGNQWEINALYSHREQLEVGNIFKINVFAHFWSKCDFFDWHFF